MNTILFDLDGTLLPMDTQEFMNLYSRHLTEAFKTIDDSGKIFEYVMDSVKHTVLNKEYSCNYDKFFAYFDKYTKTDLQNYINTFDAFYEDGFHHVKPSTYVSDEMLEAVEILKNKGYKLLIVTNPIFPMIANKKRIEWAGLNIDHFEYVSSFENNHYCKPHLEFYEEVLKHNNLEPGQVLMVGNDAQEDLSIKNLGAQTYLLNNHLIDRTNGQYHTDFEGNFSDFLAFSKTLQKVDGIS